MEDDSFASYFELFPLVHPVTGSVVVGKVTRIEFDGIHVNFGGPGDGFAPTSELAIPPGSTVHDVMSIDETVEFVVVDDDNTSHPYILSQRARRAGGRFGGDGVDSSTGRRGWFSHYTGSGQSKVAYRSRSDAIDALHDLHVTEDRMTMGVYRCMDCRRWHIGREP